MILFSAQFGGTIARGKIFRSRKGTWTETLKILKQKGIKKYLNFWS